MRAIDQITDENPKIMPHSIAPRLVDTTSNDERLTPILGHPFAKQWRAGFLIRNRYAEYCVAGKAGVALEK